MLDSTILSRHIQTTSRYVCCIYFKTKAESSVIDHCSEYTYIVYLPRNQAESSVIDQFNQGTFY